MLEASFLLSVFFVADAPVVEEASFLLFYFTIILCYKPPSQQLQSNLQRAKGAIKQGHQRLQNSKQAKRCAAHIRSESDSTTANKQCDVKPTTGAKATPQQQTSEAMCSPHQERKRPHNSKQAKRCAAHNRTESDTYTVSIKLFSVLLKIANPTKNTTNENPKA